MDQTVTLVLRFIHIVGGVFWVGAVFLMVGFIFPTVRNTGPQGGRFMQELMQRRRLSVFMNAAAGLTMLSGSYCMGAFSPRRTVAGGYTRWNDVRDRRIGNGDRRDHRRLDRRRSGQRLAKLGETVHASGGPPSTEQAAEMGRLQTRMGKAMRAVAVLLLIAVTSMATARYL